MSIDVQLQLKELELQSLLEVTQAINENADEADLYKMYKFTLRPNKHISKLALYVFDEAWNYKISFGTDKGNDYAHITLPNGILECTTETNIEQLEDIGVFKEFQKVLPVKHKSTILAYILVSFAKIETFDEDFLMNLENFIEALTNVIIVAVENKKLARKQQQQEQFKAQLMLAKNVQQLLFPKKLPYTNTLKIVADYLPHQTVGGDYYDYILINDHKFLLCIADVSGKGIPAALLMSNFQAALRILVRQHLSLKKIIHELNHLVWLNTQGESFATAFFMEYDFKTKQMTYVNAGHNPPLLFQNYLLQELKEGTTILGSFKELPFVQITEINHIESFFLFCFTDGFTETVNEQGEEFGSDQLAAFIEAHKHLDQQELHKELIKVLYQYKGKNEYIDDITLLSCGVKNN